MTNQIDLQIGMLLDGRYKLLRPLSAHGGTADVWLALDQYTVDESASRTSDSAPGSEESGIKVAIKICRPHNDMNFGEQSFRDEFKIVFNCHHSNLLRPINFSVCDGVAYLVLPFCAKGSSERLAGHISSPEALWRYISDVSEGLSYLHDLNPTIVHNDIKPANILIDDNGNYSITDFGISLNTAKAKSGAEYSSGTMAYMAPERFYRTYKAQPASDIWAFGASLYELITGDVPFGEEGGRCQLKEKKPVPRIKHNIPSDIRKLINDCLNEDPAKRPTARQIARAARGKHYPARNTKLIVLVAALAVVLVLVGLLLFVKPESNPQSGVAVYKEVPRLSDAEIYEQALADLRSDDPETLKKGLVRMDSLGSTGYIPAMYESAFTYGWYSDPESVRRKDVLNIEYLPATSQNKYLPVSDKVNIKAVGLLSKIEDTADPEYPYINAMACYRLAVYYANTDRVVNKSHAKARALLIKAREYAEQTDELDSNFISDIDGYIKALDDIMK